jgi:ubiquinone/menaquinone biosynthesis C-methylase UbiE
MANDEQREAWNGVSGAQWTQRQDQFDGMLAPWIPVLADAARITEGEHVLDIGCGCGATTLEAARRCGPTGIAAGVDLSAPMIDRARQLADAAGVVNARFEVGDCQVDDLTVPPAGPYDLAISRFGVMFFDDPVAAFANVAKAMAPGGRLAVLTWAPMELQRWLTVPIAAALDHVPLPDLGQNGGTGMFSLAQHDRIVAVLEAAGWADVAVEPHRRPVLIAGGGSLDETMDFLLATGAGRALLAGAPDEQAAERAVAAIRTTLPDHQTSRGVELDGTALAITAVHP